MTFVAEHETNSWFFRDSAVLRLGYKMIYPKLSWERWRAVMTISRFCRKTNPELSPRQRHANFRPHGHKRNFGRINVAFGLARYGTANQHVAAVAVRLLSTLRCAPFLWHKALRPLRCLRNSPPFVEPGALLSWSLESSSVVYPEPTNPPHAFSHYFFKNSFNSIFLSTSSSKCPASSMISDYKFACHLLSVVHVTCLSFLNLLNLIILLIFGVDWAVTIILNDSVNIGKYNVEW